MSLRGGKRWIFAAPPEGAVRTRAGDGAGTGTTPGAVSPADMVAELVRELGLLPAVARVLINRGLGDLERARAFLNPSLEQLASPWLMRGMDRAVERILQALQKGEQVAVYGDYDADGITATVLLVEVLRELGGAPRFVLPSRFDAGYGLHYAPLAELREAGCTLVITVDCGITAAEPVERARALGLDLVITDHHRPCGVLPRAVAVVNPLQEGCPYPYKELAGVGIAYQLAAALFERAGGGDGAASSLSAVTEKLDLVALGTVADVVPLTGENRVLVALGLEQMNRRHRPGLQTLVEACGLKAAQLNSGHLGFILAPALNAAGRMGDPAPAVRLLLEREAAVARPLAAHLRQENRRRREIELQVLAEAETVLQEGEEMAVVPGERRVLVAAGQSWHPGVIGIVASRLVEKYYRPAVLVALEGEAGRGSARSIPGFDITAALEACAPLLDHYGGHPQAAGLAVAVERVPELAAALEEHAATVLSEAALVPELILDGVLAAEEISLELVRQLARLEPFGMGNREPLFCSRSWDLRSWRLVGRGRSHLKLNLCREGYSLQPIFFAAAAREAELQRGRALDLAFTLREGFFRGEATLEVILEEFAYGDSYRSGRVTVIDRRGAAGGRAGYIRELLLRRGDGHDGAAGKTVALFCSTAARRERLSRSLAGVEPAGPGESAAARDLVLHDLPVHFSAIAPFFEAAPAGAELRVHLLYCERDLHLNTKLIEAALPGPAALREIGRALKESAAAGSLTQTAFTKLLPAGVGSGWRRRCLKILLEAGLLERTAAGSLRICDAAEAGAVAESGVGGGLEVGSAFAEACTLREQCRHFQRVLLEGTGEAVAALLEQSMIS